MLRRTLIKKFVLDINKKPCSLTDQMDPLNKFADLYNEYINKLATGVRDLKLARKVVEEFDKLVIK